ncbi:MAG: thiol peroxidase [Candidatus Rifleibacteriota bacterium]
MTQETGKVTFKGNPLTLVGEKKSVGDEFPKGITLINNDLSPFNLDEVKGPRVVTTVPSLDTPVCDTHVRKFNEKAAGLNADVIAVSADLPFAQARWCGQAGIEKVKTFSDYQNMALAEALGIKVKELRLFARTVMVVDSDNKITYMQIVPEIAEEPNYEAALEALEKAK